MLSQNWQKQNTASIRESTQVQQLKQYYSKEHKEEVKYTAIHSLTHHLFDDSASA